MLRKNLLPILIVLLVAVIAVSTAVFSHPMGETTPQAYLPLVYKPLPTSTPTPTVTPAPTYPPGPTPTPSYNAGQQLLANGSFELGWTDLPPAPGNLINQRPNGWEIYFVPIDQPLFDSSDLAGGIPESIHKNVEQLPLNERPGGPDALILEGVWVYKTFHGGAPFGTELKQTITGLTPGMPLHLVVPIQLHRQGGNDTYGAESGVWVQGNGLDLGNWVNADVMGDRQWYDHVYDFNAPADGTVTIIIRVKSKWPAAKDFFFDVIRLEAR